ncbi:ABC transporter ATP-binding protein [Amedibacillus sp. YH-ame6]
MSTIIEIKDLTKSYGKHRGIEYVNLTIEKGEIFGFIGPNGAGKSTTIRTLLGLIHPTSGTATIFGKDCIACRDENAKNIGYLPSEVFYYDHMKVKDLLAYSASFYKKDCSARIKELCELLELDVNRKIEDLSYGNRKKVGIVQGLLHSPELIVLDEPTSGLDPLMQNKFFELIRKENEKGVTIFFSSHILGEVQKMCDRVGIIKDGKILKIETMENLRMNTYKRVDVMCKEDSISQIQTLTGVSQFVKNEDLYSFMYNGNLNGLLKELSKHTLENLEIHEPDLEDIFMQYYEEERL